MNELGDTPAPELREQLRLMSEWAANYRETIAARPVAPGVRPGEITRRLPRIPPEKPETFAEIFADFQEIIVPGVLNWSHPQFLAYFGSTSTAPGLLGEIAAAALNVNAMTWRTCPAATELETVVVEWLRQWLHLPPEFGGVVFDTASIGIMHALATAREELVPGTREYGVSGAGVLRVYTSDQAHSSVEKAAIALGVGEKNVVRIPTDDCFRMRTGALRDAVHRDLAAGMKPLAVVTTCGTTSTASVDPTPAIAELCREKKIWLHIDAAYGGGVALLPEHSAVAAAWANADSLVINPHKMLFVPFDFSVLYVKDVERLRLVFTLVPEYLQGDTLEAERNYMDYGVPLGRRFRALKAWMVFRTFGREGMAARIRDHLRLALLFAEWVQATTGWELAAPVSMGVVCFRATFVDESSRDKLNAAIVEGVNLSGRAYLTQTKLRARTVIRLGLGNILTTEDHLRDVWQLLQERADALSPSLRS